MWDFRRSFVYMILILSLVINAKAILARSSLIYSNPQKQKRPVVSQDFRGAHFTPWLFSSKEKTDEIINSYLSSNLNTIVIAMKTEDGFIPYDSKVELVVRIGSGRPVITDPKALVKKLHSYGIYTIARVVVFQDAFFAREKPNCAVKRGGAWTNPYNRVVWKYNIDIAKELVRFGFDEINFDYIRFPTSGDGPLYKDINYLYPNYEAIEGFLKRANRELKAVRESVKISADVFGIIGMKSSEDVELIGQRVKEMAKFLDFICPMNYPSHMTDDFIGFNIPRLHPYDTMKQLTEKIIKGVNLDETKVRPWIQDFPYRVDEIFNDGYVLSQINAVDDTEAAGWLAWNASGNYSWKVYVVSKVAPPM